MASNIICGIYKITNLKNNKIYIGQSINIYKRWRAHLCASNHPHNKDFSSPIHQAIYKYGIQNFSLEILEKCNKNELDKKEKFWINYYNSYKNGYNATTGGQDGGGYNGKVVELYDLNGKYIKEYPNAKETAKALNISYSVIQQVLHLKRPTCGGYQLKYKEDSRIITKYKSNQGGKKQVYQYDLQNNLVAIYDSVNEAGRKTNLDSSTISKVCRGKLKTCGGYKWSYIKL